MSPKFIEKIKLQYMFWWLRRLPDCDQTTQLLSQSMEQNLTLKQRINIRLHLHVCAWCKQYRDQIQLLRKAFRFPPNEEKQTDVFPLDSLSDEAKEKMKRTISSK